MAHRCSDNRGPTVLTLHYKRGELRVWLLLQNARKQVKAFKAFKAFRNEIMYKRLILTLALSSLLTIHFLKVGIKHRIETLPLKYCLKPLSKLCYSLFQMWKMIQWAIPCGSLPKTPQIAETRHGAKYKSIFT